MEYEGVSLFYGFTDIDHAIRQPPKSVVHALLQQYPALAIENDTVDDSDDPIWHSGEGASGGIAPSGLRTFMTHGIAIQSWPTGGCLFGTYWGR